MKFYKGQPVRHVHAGNPFDNLTWGKTYTLVDLVKWSTEDHAVIINDAGKLDQLHVDWFEPIYTPIADLKVGDRVMALGPVDTHFSAKHLGQVGTLREIEPYAYDHVLFFDDHRLHTVFAEGWFLFGSMKVVRLEPKEAPVKSEEIITLGVAPSLADDLRLKPQARTILAHLRRHKTISNQEALTIYTVPRLAASIYELREHGYKIEGKLKKDDVGHRYTRYSLAA